MTQDKIDNHYFQQLSALVDGDLPPDQARFLLRRLEHDTELSDCLARWQLCGDVLRGRAQAPAPAGFAGRVAAAVAQEPVQGASQTPARSRHFAARWAGGALAASVAAIALFMVRQQVPDETPSQAAPAIAGRSAGEPLPSPEAAPVVQTAALASVAGAAVASAPRRPDAAARRSATRTQQAARAAAARVQPERALASAAVPVVHAIASAAPASERDPFSNVQINPPAARPWPRAVLPQYDAGSGAFNAGYSTDRAAGTFYPFEPRLPASPPIMPPEPRNR